MVAYIEELEQMDASEVHARRINAKEVLTPQRSGDFICPIADGTVKIFGREQRLENQAAYGTVKNSGEDQDLRTSTFIPDSPDQGEEQDNLQPNDKTHHGMMVKPKVIFGLSQEILFTVITWNPESNCTCRLKNH